MKVKGAVQTIKQIYKPDQDKRYNSKQGRIMVPKKTLNTRHLLPIE